MPRSRSRRIRLVDVLVLSSSASALTLSNIQLIASNGIPLGCVVAYNTPLSGCTDDDFMSKTCSAACVRSIEIVVANIQSACESVRVSPNSVLGLAISGKLTDALCPGNKDDDDDDDDVTSTTRRGTTIFTTRPTSTTSTRTTVSTPFTADPPAQTENPSQPPPSVTQNPGDGGAATTLTTSNQAPPQETDALDAGGGGSPFDPIQIASEGDRSISRIGWLTSLAIVSVTAAFAI